MKNVTMVDLKDNNKGKNPQKNKFPKNSRISSFAKSVLTRLFSFSLFALILFWLGFYFRYDLPVRKIDYNDVIEVKAALENMYIPEQVPSMKKDRDQLLSLIDKSLTDERITIGEYQDISAESTYFKHKVLNFRIALELERQK